MTNDLPTLIAALDTDDARAQQHTGQRLLDAGAAALPGLLAAITSPSPQVRKAVAFLLGRTKPSPEVVQALAAALSDSEPESPQERGDSTRHAWSGRRPSRR